MKKTFREGNVGALMDEYERAATELKQLVGRIPEETYVKILDSSTDDEDCRSVQTIMAHVIKAGYGYANYIREYFNIQFERPTIQLVSRTEALKRFDEMLEYTVQTLEGRWVTPDEEILKSSIQSRWGQKYDFEQLLEHAIVHLLRHRRQIEKLTASAN